MKSSTSTFKIFKSGWGIWIRISGETVKINSPNSILKIHHTNPNLTDNETKFLQKGFDWIIQKIEEKNQPAYQISITKIETVLTDYQEEGLFFAIAYWLSEHFKFEMPYFNFRFNKTINKYEFPDLEDLMK